jgi:hypothetical protein
VPVNLGRFKVGDEETVDAGEGMYFFPTNTTLAANGVFTVAERGLNFIGKLGYAPDGEFNATTNTVPDMVRYTIWATGVWALSNTGDEILVLDGSDTIVDGVAYGTGSYSGITAITAPGSEQMLRRLPANGDTDNCSTDFVNVGAPGAPLKILTCAVADSLPCLAWQEVAGDYTVEMSTNLLTGSWQAAPGTTWPISTCAWTSSVPATAAQAFYHVKRN